MADQQQHIAAEDDLFVSTLGKDTWSGTLPEPNADATDGPLASIVRAQQILRQRKGQDESLRPTTVWLRGGVYRLDTPLVFTPEDSGPVTYAAWPGEVPILDGGRTIQGLREQQLNGHTVWVADLPQVQSGQWYFRSLFARADATGPGIRRPRARTPKATVTRPDFYRIESVPGHTFEDKLRDSSDRFIAQPGQFAPYRNLADVEVVLLHYWIDERLPVVSFDPATRQVTLAKKTIYSMKQDIFTDAPRAKWSKYYLDNVFEALSEPGEWYLDRAEGRLYYAPGTAETLDSVHLVAPGIEQFIIMQGEIDGGRYVEGLRFVGITFQHTDHHIPDTLKFQAGSGLPGAITMIGARQCAIADCTIRHVGWTAIVMEDGCTDNWIVGNHITDMGGGGVRLTGSDVNGPVGGRTGRNRITDNHIHHGGEIYFQAAGIISMHSFANEIAHNHVHHLYYTGISVGWIWGFRPSISWDNLIEYNHVHDLGFGWLSDMGCIYTLGVQPGTIIRGNLLHGIESDTYGGWGVYLDEGSSHILVENNIAYGAGHEPFHQHYGRENMIRNNVFIGGKGGVLAVEKTPLMLAVVAERNILVTDGAPLVPTHRTSVLGQGNAMICDLNLIWDVGGKPITAMKVKDTDRPTLDLAAWQKLGYDVHSIVADPKFQDPARANYMPADDSPALKVGFRPFSLAGVGPRSRENRPPIPEYQPGMKEPLRKYNNP